MALKRKLVAGLKYGLMWTSPDIKGLRGLPAFTTVVSIETLPSGDAALRTIKVLPINVKLARGVKYTPAQIDILCQNLAEIRVSGTDMPITRISE